MSNMLNDINFGSLYWWGFIAAIIIYWTIEFKMTERIKTKYLLHFILGLFVTWCLTKILKEYGIEANNFPISAIIALVLGLIIKLLIDFNKSMETISEYDTIVSTVDENITKMENFVSMLDKKMKKNEEILKTLEQNIENLKYSEKWHRKIKNVATDNTLHKNIWQKMALKYFHVQDRNIEGNKFVISLDFYPQVTEELFNFYKNFSTAKFEIVSTMLPQHYFEFPSYERGELEYKPVSFVIDYRDKMESLIQNSFKMTFNRYTLVLSDEEESQGVFSETDFFKSKDKYSENKKSTHYDYFINKLHPTADSLFIKQFEKNNLPKYTNFLRIEKDDYSVYIVVKVSIRKKICMIEIIDCNSNEEEYKEITTEYEQIIDARSIECN